MRALVCRTLRALRTSVGGRRSTGPERATPRPETTGALVPFFRLRLRIPLCEREAKRLGFVGRGCRHYVRFGAERRLAEAVPTRIRYYTARAAALAGCCQGLGQGGR
jgi:hypothetical protein